MEYLESKGRFKIYYLIKFESCGMVTETRNSLITCCTSARFLKPSSSSILNWYGLNVVSPSAGQESNKRYNDRANKFYEFKTLPHILKHTPHQQHNTPCIVANDLETSPVQ